MTTVTFGCCFCGKAGADKSLVIADKSTGQMVQQYWCHEQCLLDAMTTDARAVYQVGWSDTTDQTTDNGGGNTDG